MLLLPISVLGMRLCYACSELANFQFRDGKNEARKNPAEAFDGWRYVSEFQGEKFNRQAPKDRNPTRVLAAFWGPDWGPLRPVFKIFHLIQCVD
jgi:hypothetical protein